MFYIYHVKYMVNDHLNYVDDTLGCDAVNLEFNSQQSAACLEDEGSVLNQNRPCHVSEEKKNTQTNKQKTVIRISPRFWSLKLAVLCCGRLLPIVGMI